MNKRIIVALLCISCFPVPQVYAKSVRGHIIASASFVSKSIIAPFKGVFVDGPKNVKKSYQYEVHGREKIEKRGLLRYKLFAYWCAPGEELKGVIDGCTESVDELGKGIKNIISIFFSDS